MKERVRMRVRIEKKTYTALQSAAARAGKDEGSALMEAIERGMERYWSRWFENIAKDYELLKRRYEECRKDNELMSALIEQNNELRQLLDS